MIQEFLSSVRAYLDILPIISKFKLWRYIILAGLISLSIGGSIFYTGYQFGDNFGAMMISWYPFEFGADILSGIANFIGGALLIFGSFFVYKYVILIVLSPLLSHISEKVEMNMRVGHAEKVRFSISGAISDIMRGIKISARNIFKELLLTLLILITGFLPGVNVITTPLLFLVQAYFAGFGNLDFYLERHLKFRPSIDFVKSHKGLAAGNGSIFLLLLLIPVVGVIIAPTFATIAASYRVHPYFDHVAVDDELV